MGEDAHSCMHEPLHMHSLTHVFTLPLICQAGPPPPSVPPSPNVTIESAGDSPYSTGSAGGTSHPNAARRISQQTFDESVRENMIDFSTVSTRLVPPRVNPSSSPSPSPSPSLSPHPYPHPRPQPHHLKFSDLISSVAQDRKEATADTIKQYQSQDVDLTGIDTTSGSDDDGGGESGACSAMDGAPGSDHGTNLGVD